MRKTLKRIGLLSVAVVFAILLIFSATACNSESYEEIVDNTFNLSAYSATVDIGEDGTASITESITVTFLRDYKRGIIRDLPTHAGEGYKIHSVKQSLVEWGSVSARQSRGSTIPNNYFLTAENGFISINTGTKDSEADYFFNTGDKVLYTFAYTITPPAKYAKADNYYINVLGNGWSTSVSDISITVEFPSAVERVYLPYGKLGSTTAVKYAVEGGALVHKEGSESKVSASLPSANTLIITADNMAAYNGITLQADIAGKLSRPFDLRIFIAILVAVIFAGILIVLKLLRPEKAVVEVVNFYPPKENGLPLNPAELGILIDGDCSASDVTSLIFYWASRGNLQIEEIETGEGKKKKKEINLIKLVDLPANAPAYEKQMYAALFKSGNRVGIKSLENKFYVHIAAAQSAINKKYNGKLHKYGRCIAVAVASCAIAFFGFLIYGFTIGGGLFFTHGVAAAIPVAILVVSGSLRMLRIHKMSDKNRLSSFIGLSVLAAVLTLIFGIMLKGCMSYAYSYSLCAAACFGGLVAPLFITKTDVYREKLGDIIGFKNFIQSAEKDRLEALLEENPQYYYDVLPYANVLGVSEIWEKKFEGLTLIPPSYYYSPTSTIFSIIVFNSLYHSMFSSIRTAAISRPSSSGKSGGGFGGFGGGFSGGGFGGGGGRSR